MNYERTCELIQNDSYEIIELIESEPIVFKQTRRKQQELYNQSNIRIIPVIPTIYQAYFHKSVLKPFMISMMLFSC
jgi:hypothetical protein